MVQRVQADDLGQLNGGFQLGEDAFGLVADLGQVGRPDGIGKAVPGVFGNDLKHRVKLGCAAGHASNIKGGPSLNDPTFRRVQRFQVGVAHDGSFNQPDSVGVPSPSLQKPCGNVAANQFEGLLAAERISEANVVDQAGNKRGLQVQVGLIHQLNTKQIRAVAVANQVGVGCLVKHFCNCNSNWGVWGLCGHWRILSHVGCVRKDRNPRDSAMSQRTVFLCVDQFQLIDLAGPMDVFDTANRLRGGVPYYQVTVASVVGGELRSSSGLSVTTRAAADIDGPIDTLVVTGSFPERGALTEADFTNQCQVLGARSKRIVSVCNGAFALGAAGFFDGRRVTTHWSVGNELAAANPTAIVDPGRIFVQDGSLFTSGGASAGIDLALALVAQDLGVDVARAAAKWLVVFLRRPGGQSQFTTATPPASSTRVPIESALQLMHEDPAADHRVEVTAHKVGLSARHFSRLFKAETGTTVANYVEALRLGRAALLLESTELDHETIAKQAGFSSGEVMRQVFHRERGISPLSHREHFAEPASA